MIDYNRFLDAALEVRKPRQPDEFTISDVTQRLGSESCATKWVAERLAAGKLTRRKLGKLFLYRPTECVNGQGPQETPQ